MIHKSTGEYIGALRSSKINCGRSENGLGLAVNGFVAYGGNSRESGVYSALFPHVY